MTADPHLRTKADLDAQLVLLRGAGGDDFVLVGRALAPWHISWGEMNNVETMQSPGAPLGVLYLINRAALSTLPEDFQLG